MKKDTKIRGHNNSMVTARIREELDYSINVKKEDKLIVMGLELAVAMPSDKVEQKSGTKKWLLDLVGPGFDSVLADSSKGIALVTPGRRVERGVPIMCKVRMKNRLLAIAVSKEFARQRKVDMA